MSHGLGTSLAAMAAATRACRQLSHRTTQTSRTPARNVLASLSKHVAIALECLILLKKRSTRLRSQSSAKSQSRISFRLAFGGMTRRDVARFEPLDERVGVVALVSNHGVGREGFEAPARPALHGETSPP